MGTFLRLTACLFALLGTAAAAAPRLTLDGVTIGQGTREMRDALGDPLLFVSQGRQQIWRYLERGGSIYLDVLVRGNVAWSVTVIARFPKSAFTDDDSVSFGMSAADVKSRLGEPARVTTNGDDGSIDLWYRMPAGVRIYELKGDRLGFIQVLPLPSTTFPSGEGALPDDGTSLANAIRIRPPDFIGDSAWIESYLSQSSCGSDGHWKNVSAKFQPDSTRADLLAYTIVHVRCTSGSSERDFFFDTAGTMKKGPNGRNR